MIGHASGALICSDCGVGGAACGAGLLPILLLGALGCVVYNCNGRPVSSIWFDRFDLPPSAQEHTPSVEASVAQRNTLIDDILEAFGITRSLSQAGCPYDNAVAESTYRAFKMEFVH